MADDPFRFADQFGPAKVIHIYEPALDLKAVLVVDNVAAGPAIGGVRMAPDVSTEECFRLARAMTLKNAAAGLPHGGGKSVIFGNPKQSADKKQQVLRAFACAISQIEDYIAGPDMGTDETCMAWVKDEIGRAVGLPVELGGIPLDQIGATGYGLAVCAEAAEATAGIDLAGARLVVQGFGSVGKHAARFLAAKGAMLVAAADSTGTVADPEGIDVASLIVALPVVVCVMVPEVAPHSEELPVPEPTWAPPLVRNTMALASSADSTASASTVPDRSALAAPSVAVLVCPRISSPQPPLKLRREWRMLKALSSPSPSVLMGVREELDEDMSVSR